MALIDHFAPDAGPISDGGNGFDRLSANGLTSCLGLLLNDSTKADARVELIAKFNLDATDLIQMDELLDASYAGSATSASKQKEFRDVRDAFVLYEGGFITKLRAETNAQLTPS